MDLVKTDNGITKFVPDHSEIAKGETNPEDYLEHSKEQILKGIQGLDKEVSSSSVKAKHESNTVFWLDWHVAAVDPGDDYRAALNIADVKTPNLVGADFVGSMDRYCNEADSIVKRPVFSFPGEGSEDPRTNWNPMRFWRNNNQRANNASSNVFDMLRAKNITMMDLTFPEKISRAYENCDDFESFEDRCWDTFKLFYGRLKDLKCDKGEHLAAHANLHNWHSDEPMKPHLHFHVAFPMVQGDWNTRDVRDKVPFKSRKVRGNIEIWKDETLDVYNRMKGKRDANQYLANEMGIHHLNFEDYENGKAFHHEDIRTLWKRCVKDVFDEFDDPYDDKDASVYLHWYNRNEEPEKILHKFRYKTRRVAYDLFKYYSDSDLFEDQDTPNHITAREIIHKDFLNHALNYENRSRAFGLYAISTVFEKLGSEGVAEICPCCGGDLVLPEDKHYSDCVGRTVVYNGKHKFKMKDPPPESVFTSFFF